MPIITLPNGHQKSFDHPVSVMEVAQSIGPGLAKNTVAGRVNDRLVDACDLITEASTWLLFTPDAA
ncbi:TGS domain-containing protein, partial [Acinetobacter baumannii]|uniref:TGS domain-containing protein n=1 Tax=Acinetobacter baumannii TaxID=470 RepID=UPI00105A28F4